MTRNEFVITSSQWAISMTEICHSGDAAQPLPLMVDKTLMLAAQLGMVIGVIGVALVVRKPALTAPGP